MFSEIEREIKEKVDWLKDQLKSLTERISELEKEISGAVFNEKK